MKGLAVLMLSALVLCSACTKVNYKMVGKFDDYNELIIGDLEHDLAAGVAQITAWTENSGITCRGSSRVTYVPPNSGFSCAGQRGDARLTCDDGRVAVAEWEAQSCTEGYGVGTTDDGGTFMFAFGLSEQEAKLALDILRPEVASKPDIPVYRPRETREEIGFSTGTGFFVTRDGYMITNYHVIEGAAQVGIVMEEDIVPAQVVRYDPENDVALLKVRWRGTPLPVPMTASVSRADEVFTLGYPAIMIQGQAQKATFGRVNALSGMQDDPRFLQIDVPIQPGNSGGPLINDAGEVVGIVTMTLNALVAAETLGTLPQNVNYAVKSDFIIPLLRSVPGWTPPTTMKRVDLSQLVARYEQSVFLVVAQ